ncbi:hypothetical protein AAHA92_06351 [Salvia divinorum]|uniref:Uncharacterized protein n=1 Tax=Salvia divinorum TaxID=28513 RepID=A0ABD1I8H1_SALDI
MWLSSSLPVRGGVARYPATRPLPVQPPPLLATVRGNLLSPCATAAVAVVVWAGVSATSTSPEGRGPASARQILAPLGLTDHGVELQI